MRININNPEHIEMVSDLCNSMDCSPTQMIINLINESHQQQHAQGCKEDAKNTSKERKD
ncbi:hypothetical protein VPH184E373B_0155 [Vibrio phage 184E37-3b]|nr:hypothetical protein MYOV056v2_p0136 [Vibrio phage 184E37.3a]QZI89918.1 hypothetical protein MYOV057v1_p0003 [Vibrio phage 184E37.1]